MTDVKVGEVTVLLNPRAEKETVGTPLASRLPTLGGATIAVINSFQDQKRSNGELFARRVGEILLREGAAQVLDVLKEDSGSDLPEETLEHIVSRTQGAIILEGD